MSHTVTSPEADNERHLDILRSFEQDQVALEQAAAIFEERSFAKLVLYPLHEETVKRMFKEPVSPYYKREKQLQEWIEEHGSS